MKELGKITSIKFGHVGYQDACLGIHVTLEIGSGGGVGHSKDAWDANLIPCSEHAKWTEEDRSKQYDEIMRYISDLLYKAKVSDITKLKGVPVEIEMENNCLKSWRILEEVL